MGIIKPELNAVLLIAILINSSVISTQSQIQLASNQLSFIKTSSIDWDSYSPYPIAWLPTLPINSTIYEDIEYQSHLIPSSIENLPLQHQQAIFLQSIVSPQFKASFTQFLTGLLSAWRQDLSFLNDLLQSPDFPQGDLWTGYYQLIQLKQKDLSVIVTKPIPNDKPVDDKKKQCNEIMKKNLMEINWEIFGLSITIDHHIEDLNKAKGQLDIEAGLRRIIEIHQQAVKDYMKDRRQIKQIDCMNIITNPNMSFNYAMLVMTDHLKPFLAEYEKSMRKAIRDKKRAVNVITHALNNILKYTKQQSTDPIEQILSIKAWGSTKALFYLIRLILSVYKLYRSYKSRQLDQLAYALGKAIGLSIRLNLASIQ